MQYHHSHHLLGSRTTSPYPDSFYLSICCIEAPTEKFHTTGRSVADKLLLRQYMLSGVDRYFDDDDDDDDDDDGGDDDIT
jgi:hypothetical protein